MNLLFVCARNRRRSPTAEALFAGVGGVETDSAGLSPDAEQRLAAEQIAWADIVFVMERRHRSALTRGFGTVLRGKRVVCLGIPDDYEFDDPELIRLLWERVPRSVPALVVGKP